MSDKYEQEAVWFADLHNLDTRTSVVKELAALLRRMAGEDNPPERRNK